MTVLITGARGMLGRTLMLRLAPEMSCVGIDIGDCDITRPGQVDRCIAEAAPDVVLHCAAMTAVDACETRQDEAWAVNAVGSANVAGACYRHGARLVAISTDYVFGGDLNRPYHEFDATNPRTVYGQSKLAGEQAVRRHCPNHVIARTAWLYGQGGPSFLHTMLRLASQDGPPLRVVNDQVGNPTSCEALADGLRQILRTPIVGTVHLSCEGQSTWFEFTREIFRLAGIAREVVPCTTADFPRPAARPANSALDKLVLRLQGLTPMPRWQDALKQFLKEHHNDL
jgi:dTDP-4-dehydrorhamnose reductase